MFGQAGMPRLVSQPGHRGAVDAPRLDYPLLDHAAHGARFPAVSNSVSSSNWEYNKLQQRMHLFLRLGASSIPSNRSQGTVPLCRRPRIRSGVFQSRPAPDCRVNGSCEPAANLPQPRLRKTSMNPGDNYDSLHARARVVLRRRFGVSSASDLRHERSEIRYELAQPVPAIERGSRSTFGRARGLRTTD